MILIMSAFLYRCGLNDLHALLVGQFLSSFVHRLWQTVVLTVVNQIWTVTSVHHLQFRIFEEELHVLLALLSALVLNQGDSLFEGDGHRIAILGKRGVFAVVEHVGTKAASTDGNGLAFVVAQIARQLKEFECLFECNSLDAVRQDRNGQSSRRRACHS